MNYKKITVGATTSVASVTAIIAGTQAEAEGWAGTYAGLSINHTSGEYPWAYSGDSYEYDFSDTVLGAFLGHDWVSANGIPLGVEIAYQGSTEGKPVGTSTTDEDYSMGQIVDAKFRLGMPTMSGAAKAGGLGPAQFYVFGGLSGGEVGSGADGTYNAWGLNFGGGVEFNVSENAFIGLELIGRNMNGYSEGEASNTQLSYGVSLRAAIRF